MTVRKVSLASLVVGLIFILAACSSTGTPQKLSGAEAKANLISVLQSSEQTFKTGGGSESITVDPNKFALIYDPTAADGKKIVTVDIDKPDGAVFNKDATLSLTNFIAALNSDSFKDATYTYADGVYHVTTPTVTVDIWTKDSKVSSIATIVTSSKVSSIVVIGYGVTSGAKTFLATAAANATK